MINQKPVRRVLTGMRTTGALHLGHKVGALDLWLEAQKDPDLECFFLLADMQALTTHADQPILIRDSVRQVVLDWIAVGLKYWEPNVHFVLQSQVPARGQLTHLFLNVARWSEIERNPTVKAEKEAIGNPSAGFMIYVVDQAGDIYMVSPLPERGNELLVPVGEDQLPHLNDARRWAKRFNRDYGPIFRPCEGQVGIVGRLVGTDGQAKMGKSTGNAIMLSDTPNEVVRKVMSMYTDPKRVHATDPGTVEGNPLFTYLDVFAPDSQLVYTGYPSGWAPPGKWVYQSQEVEEYKKLYRLGQIGDVTLKQRLAEILNQMLDPIRERRAEAEKLAIGDIVKAGTARANEIADEVLARAMEAMYLGFPNNP